MTLKLNHPCIECCNHMEARSLDRGPDCPPPTFYQAGAWDFFKIDEKLDGVGSSKS